MCNKYMVQERLFCKEMWSRCEAGWINRHASACTGGRPFGYHYAWRRPSLRSRCGLALPLCLVPAAHGANHPSRGWHGTENRPLMFLSNWHGPAGKAKLQRAGLDQPGPQDGEREHGRKGGGKEAPLNDPFPWRWVRKRVRTFSVETNSGSHSPSLKPRWPHWPLGRQDLGRDVQAGAASLSSVDYSKACRWSHFWRPKLEELRACRVLSGLLITCWRHRDQPPSRQGCGRCPPALLLLAGITKVRVISTVAATIAFLMLLCSLLIPSDVCVCMCVWVTQSCPTL